MSRYYKLDKDKRPVKVQMLDWARLFDDSDSRAVGKTQISGEVEVSTVFLGLDRNHGASGPPVLWETMIFGGRHDGYQERYTSHADAVKGHKLACQIARGEVEP